MSLRQLGLTNAEVPPTGMLRGPLRHLTIRETTTMRMNEIAIWVIASVGDQKRRMAYGV
jgi:hypothetical protein